VSSATLIEKCCLIACPVAGNPTHYMIEQAFAQQGLDWRFMTFEVPSARFGDAMRGIRALGFRGVKIAEPHQGAVLEFLDDLSDEARICGSANCVTCQDDRLKGNNTEGAALVKLLREQVDPTGKQAVVLGTGRLARVLAVALAGVGVTAITVACRSAGSGQRLVDLIQSNTSATASLHLLQDNPLKVTPDISILVNATSLGMTNPNTALPLTVAALHSKLVVAEVAYHSQRTWLTREAFNQGCRVIDGMQLYTEQTALAMQTWTGTEPDRVAMREAAEEYLGI
jgi:shikimate dehydrogenase